VSTVISPRAISKVERIARSLNHLAVILLIAFVVAAIASVAYVRSEFTDSAPAWRYALAIADVSGLLIAAVVARVGAALVQTLGRVRASLIEAIVGERLATEELNRQFPESRVG
jgi:FtsH-binding integral membrane protein